MSSWNFLSLLNKPDLMKSSSGSAVINYLVKPLNVEMGTAEQLCVASRRHRLMKLFEEDSAWEAAELSRLGLSCIKAPDCYPCCTNYQCSMLRY